MCKGIGIGIDMCFYMRMCESNALVLSRLVLTRLVLRDSGRMFRVSLLRCLVCLAWSLFVLSVVCVVLCLCVVCVLCVFASRNSVRT